MDVDCSKNNIAPRVGHPAKEGLRPYKFGLIRLKSSKPRVGHPAKEGLRQINQS